MYKKQKARPKPGKSESAESVTAPCAACGATIHIGDRIGHVFLPIGVDFDGHLIGHNRLICARCVDLVKQDDDAKEAVAGAILARDAAREEADTEGVTLQ